MRGIAGGGGGGGGSEQFSAGVSGLVKKNLDCTAASDCFVFYFWSLLEQ